MKTRCLRLGSHGMRYAFQPYTRQMGAAPPRNCPLTCAAGAAHDGFSVKQGWMRGTRVRLGGGAGVSDADPRATQLPPTQPDVNLYTCPFRSPLIPSATSAVIPNGCAAPPPPVPPPPNLRAWIHTGCICALRPCTSQ